MTLAINIHGMDFPSRSQHENPHTVENSVSKEHGTITEKSFEISSKRVEDIRPNDDTGEDTRETFPWFVLRASKEREGGIHHLPRFNAFHVDEQTCKLNHKQPNQEAFRNDDMIEKVQYEDGEQYEGCSSPRFFSRFVLTYGPIGAGVVFFWRGLWHVMDMYLFPDDLLQSGWVSLLMGLGTAVACHAISQLEFQKKWSIGTRNSSTPNLVLYGVSERCFSLLVVFGAVNYWRGVWILWDMLVLVENQVAQQWTSLAVGAGMLCLLRSFRSTFAPPMTYMNDDDDNLNGLTLKLCDDLWWKPSAPRDSKNQLTREQTTLSSSANTG